MARTVYDTDLYTTNGISSFVRHNTPVIWHCHGIVVIGLDHCTMGVFVFTMLAGSYGPDSGSCMMAKVGYLHHRL
jgi:hypothetical protein